MLVSDSAQYLHASEVASITLERAFELANNINISAGRGKVTETV